MDVPSISPIIPFGLSLAVPLSAFAASEHANVASNGGTEPPTTPNEDENSDDVFAIAVF